MHSYTGRKMENVIGTFVKLNVPEKGMELVHAWASNWRIAHAYIKDIKIISVYLDFFYLHWNSNNIYNNTRLYQRKNNNIINCY